MSDEELQRLVESGEYPSKGVARRALGIGEGLPDVSPGLQQLVARLTAGFAGARPRLR